jgi:photosystem II stability/assembly factor-like uncharacterized protein
LGYYSQYGCFRAYPAAHPITLGVVYVGTGSCNGIPVEPGTGGIYRSINHGSTWITMTDGLTDTDITDIAFHPDDPDKMLVSTYNGNLFFSTDGGQQWMWKANLGSRVNRVYFDPYGTHEAWAVMEREPAPPPYLFKSDDPTLTAWTGITVTLEPSITLPVFSLAFYSDTIWAATPYGFTSTDGGLSWSLVGEDGVCEVREFAIDPSAPHRVYAGCLNEGVRRSVDGGAHWSTADRGLAALIPHPLAVPVDDPETIYAYTSRLGILKSNNGGRAWQETGGWMGGGSGPDRLTTDPFTPTRIYAGNTCLDSLCLIISEDAGLTWRDVISTMPTALTGGYASVHVVAPHPQLPGHVLAGMHIQPTGGGSGYDGGAIFVSDDYGETWQFTWPPPTEVFSRVEAIAYDAFDANLVYAGTSGAGLWRSADAGATWQAISIAGVLPPVGISSVATHPNISHTVYVRLYSMAAGPNPEGQLFVSQDAGLNWTELEDTFTGALLHFAPPRPNMPSYALYTACDHGLCRSLGVTGTNVAWQRVEDAPRPSALASGTDGERVIVYVGSPGGIVSTVTDTLILDAASPGTIPGRGIVLSGGVYRYTSLQPGHWVYLPLVVRGIRLP